MTEITRTTLTQFENKYLNYIVEIASFNSLQFVNLCHNQQRGGVSHDWRVVDFTSILGSCGTDQHRSH